MGKISFFFVSVLFLCFVVQTDLYAGEIHEAVKRGDIETVKRLLGGNPALLNELDEAGDSPLQIAERLRNSEMVRVLRPKKKRYHRRLFVGEGDFSYTREFLREHPDPEVARNIIATEFSKKGVSKGFKANEALIREKGVAVEFGVDATTMASKFKDQNFDRIQFNFPHTRCEGHSDEMAKLVEAFFGQCSQLQKEGGRIHFTLPEDKTAGFKQYYYHKLFGLYNASRKHGYCLVGKRKFTDARTGNRYQGYKHCQTAGDRSVPAAANGREYVFVKGGKSTKKYRVDSHKLWGMPAESFCGVSTDDDSSCGWSEHDDDDEIRALAATVEGLHLNIANQETIEAITQARGPGFTQTVAPRWTPSDGDCAFHALRTTRADFLAQVACVIRDEGHGLHAEVMQRFMDQAAAGQFVNRGDWERAMRRADGAGPLWVGDFELHLWGLLNTRRVLVFTLGTNEFVHVTGGAFGVEGAPEVWIAHVNAGRPLEEGAPRHANHYIELQRSAAAKVFPAVRRNQAEADTLSKPHNHRQPPPPGAGGAGLGGQATAPGIQISAAAAPAAPNASGDAAKPSSTGDGKKAASFQSQVFNGVAGIVSGFARAVSAY